MKSLDPNYRKGEQYALEWARQMLSSELVITNQHEDFLGTDLATPDMQIGVYVRTRFGKYRDLTFNGVQAIKKVRKNALDRFTSYYAILQYAAGTGFSDPNFNIQHQYLINLGTWVRDAHEHRRTYSELNLIQKAQNGGFIVWDSKWRSYIIDEI